MKNLPHSYRRLLVALAVPVVAFVGAASFVMSAAAEDASDFELTLTVVRADPGTTSTVAEWTVPENLVGNTCAISAAAANNASVHEGNLLIVTSGEDDVHLDDVERGPGAPPHGGTDLQLAPLVQVALVMGPDGVFSAGVTVQFECQDAGPAIDEIGPTTTEQGPPTTIDTQVLPAIAQPPAPVAAQPSFTG